MKLGKACRQCRDGKRRCDQQGTGSSCRECTRRNLRCSTATAPPSNPLLSPQPRTAGPYHLAVPLLPSAEIVRELCDLYISHIHDKPHTLFHEPTLRRQFADGTVSRAVMFGVMGLSVRYVSRGPSSPASGPVFNRTLHLRFSADAGARSQIEAFTLESKKELKNDLEHMCFENVQACVLIGNLCGAEGNADSESLFFGLSSL